MRMDGCLHIPANAHDLNLKSNLQRIDTEELAALRKTISKEASKFWWQKISCYGVSTLSSIYAVVMLIQSQIDPNPSVLLYFPSIGLGLASTSGFFSLGIFSLSMREALANTAVAQINEVLDSRLTA